LALRLLDLFGVANRERLWNLRKGYIFRQGNPMEDPFRLQRPAKGRRIRAADRIEFEPVDVAEIRERFDLPQTRFARMMGISVETLRNWERGRRRPLGPSRALLRIAAAHPDLVAHVLRGARSDWSWDEEEAWEPLEVVVKRHRARVARRRAKQAETEALDAAVRADRADRDAEAAGTGGLDAEAEGLRRRQGRKTEPDAGE
jgi:DNA-binding transcriptional regulator YiaG